MIYDKLPIVFLSTLVSEKNGSTNSQIAAYILNHLEEVQNLGIKEIAKECNVAVSSISRFCKEVGLRDFAELKELLLSTDLSFEDHSHATSKQARLHDYSHKVRESIIMVEKSIDMDAVIDLCKDINEYQKVAIFGLLKAGAVAFNLQGDLLMLNKQVYTNISYSQQIQYIVAADEDDLIIIFSYTGAYFDYQELRALKKILTAPKIRMISSDEREYPECIDRTILFKSLQDQNSHPYQLQFIAGLIAQEYSRLHQLK